jgi:hypothetical protein
VISAKAYIQALLTEARAEKKRHPLMSWAHAVIAAQASLGRIGSIGHSFRLVNNEERDHLVRYLERQEAGIHE